MHEKRGGKNSECDGFDFSNLDLVGWRGYEID